MYEKLFYNFETGESYVIFYFEDTLEGLSCIWHESGEKIACIAINQQFYKAGTKILVFELKDDDLYNQYEFEPEYEKMADFVCGASCYPGEFWFEDEKHLITNSCAIYIPKGIWHAPLIYRRIDRPIFVFSTAPVPKYTQYINRDPKWNHLKDPMDIEEAVG